MSTTKNAAGIAFLSQLLADVIAGRVAIRSVEIEDHYGNGRPPTTNRLSGYSSWWLCRIGHETIRDNADDPDVVMVDDDRLRAIQQAQADTFNLLTLTQTQVWNISERLNARVGTVSPQPPPFVYMDGSGGTVADVDGAHTLLADWRPVYRYDGSAWQEGHWDDDLGGAWWDDATAADLVGIDDDDLRYHERRWAKAETRVSP